MPYGAYRMPLCFVAGGVKLATKKPTRRRQQLEIEPLNWVAPDARDNQSDTRLEQDDQEQSNEKIAKS